MVLCLFYKLIKKQHRTYILVLFGPCLWPLKSGLNSSLAWDINWGFDPGYNLGLNFCLNSCLDMVGFLEGGFIAWVSTWALMRALTLVSTTENLNSFLNIVGFLVGFCLNIGPRSELWLKPQLRPQLGPRHGGFLLFYHCKTTSNVAFCFTFYCFSTVDLLLPLFQICVIWEWGSLNVWYFHPIHLY